MTQYTGYEAGLRAGTIKVEGNHPYKSDVTTPRPTRTPSLLEQTLAAASLPTQTAPAPYQVTQGGEVDVTK